MIVSFSQSEFAIKILAKDTKTYKYKGKSEKKAASMKIRQQQEKIFIKYPSFYSFSNYVLGYCQSFHQTMW